MARCHSVKTRKIYPNLAEPLLAPSQKLQPDTPLAPSRKIHCVALRLSATLIVIPDSLSTQYIAPMTISNNATCPIFTSQSHLGIICLCRKATCKRMNFPVRRLMAPIRVNAESDGNQVAGYAARGPEKRRRIGIHSFNCLRVRFAQTSTCAILSLSARRRRALKTPRFPYRIPVPYFARIKAHRRKIYRPPHGFPGSVRCDPMSIMATKFSYRSACGASRSMIAHRAVQQ